MIGEIIACMIGLILCIIAFYEFYDMCDDFTNEFEKSCHDAIKQKEKEFEEEEKLLKSLKNWLFK